MPREQNDIIRALSDNKVVLLVLTDLSAAFDTVNRERLFMQSASPAKLSHGITYYLQNRSHTITINGKQSRSQQLECGVPQGSVLGPILFNIYTAALGLNFCRTISFRLQTSRKCCSHNNIPIRYLWTAFCVPLSCICLRKTII